MTPAKTITVIMREERSAEGGAVLAAGAVVELSERLANKLIAEGVAERREAESREGKEDEGSN